METLKFKTNIKCSGCVNTATPFLDKAAGENNWAVDTGNKDKILTITGEHALNAEKIIEAVEAAGYKAEQTN